MDQIDLHTHSIYSDGTLPPAGLVDLARENGLRAIAVTDHDTADGTAEAMKRGARLGVEVIPGIEISSAYNNLSMHILGYWFNPDDPVLRRRITRLQEWRHLRNMQIIENLQRLGIEISVDELSRHSGPGQAGRPHIASLLVNKGVVKSQERAFVRYLRKGAAAYAERGKYEAADAIAMIVEAGGLAVLAHPVNLDPSLRSIPGLLKSLQAVGLAGVEAYYPSHDQRAVGKLNNFARELGLLVTGGSDFHGNDRAWSFPAGAGQKFSVPYHLLETMKRSRAETMKKELA